MKNEDGRKIVWVQSFRCIEDLSPPYDKPGFFLQIQEEDGSWSYVGLSSCETSELCFDQISQHMEIR